LASFILRFSRTNLQGLLAAWILVVLAVVVSEFVIRRTTGHVGPVTSYIEAAVHDARERTASKFAATTESPPTAPSAPAPTQPKNLSGERLFKPVPPEQSLDKLIAPEAYGNPFVEKLPGLFIPHPFLGYIGVQSNFPFHKDYFGLRNDEDMYFGKYDPATRCQILITWSGNSEAAGFNHERTVPQFMEQILNKRDPAHVYKTLNLAVNGYALNDELMAYVTLAYALKPEFSITHSGVTDIVYGGALPGGFKQLGLIFTFDAYYRWVDLLYGVPFIDNIHPNARMIQPSRMDDLIPGILETYRRYRGIVTGNGGELIIGMPPYGKPGGENASAYWSAWAPEKLRELHDAMPRDWFIDFTQRHDIDFVDTIHTNTATARMYAGAYADEILKRMKTRMLSPLRMGATGYDGRSCRY
jgi:hypothetical protein